MKEDNGRCCDARRCWACIANVLFYEGNYLRNQKKFEKNNYRIDEDSPAARVHPLSELITLVVSSEQNVRRAEIEGNDR